MDYVWCNLGPLGEKRGESVGLKDWIKERKKTYAWLIERLQAVDPTIQITEASVSRIANGKQWPSREFVRAVAEITRGRVDGNSWVK